MVKALERRDEVSCKECSYAGEALGGTRIWARVRRTQAQCGTTWASHPWLAFPRDQVSAACLQAGPLNEVNVKEAATHAKLVWAPPRVRAEVIDILNDRKAQQLDASTPDFWILVAALRRFVSRGREAPSGVISADSAGDARPAQLPTSPVSCRRYLCDRSRGPHAEL